MDYIKWKKMVDEYYKVVGWRHPLYAVPIGMYEIQKENFLKCIKGFMTLEEWKKDLEEKFHSKVYEEKCLAEWHLEGWEQLEELVEKNRD